MATSTYSNTSPLPRDNVALASNMPTVRRIGLSDLHDALRLGWEDFKAVPSHAIMLCAIYPVLGLMLAIGLMTRIASVLLAGFCLLAAFFFHNAFGDITQLTAALKNLAIAGGLLVVFAYGQMRGSFDHMRERNRARKAELRAAHAEGKAEGLTDRVTH